MKYIFDQLWEGEIGREEAYQGFDQEESALMNQMGQYKEKLNDSLNKELFEVFEKYIECQSDLNDLNEKRVFAYGVRIGTRLALAMLTRE